MKPCFSKLSVFVLSAIALTACGGGGGSGSHDDSNDRDESLYLAFHVLDGDIENAWVYADLNRNYQWDSEKEPRASTDSGGLVTLDISKKELNETGDTRLLIIASAGSTATDHVYGSEIALTSPLTMSRNIFVNRKTPDGTAFIISPFSTLADITAGTGSNYDSRDSYRNLMGTYAEQTGAVRSIVYQDAGYNKDCTSADDVKTLIAGELLTRKGLLPGTDQDLKNLIQKYAASSGFGEALASNKALTDYVYSLVMAEISENGQITRSREEISAVITGYLKNIPDLPADDDSGKTDDDSGKTDDDSGNNEDPPAPEPTYVEITNHNLNFSYVVNTDTAILGDLDGKADVAGGREEYFSFIPHTEASLEIMGVKYGSIRVYSDGTYRYYVPYSQLNDRNWRDYSESVIFTVNGKVYTKTFNLIQDPLFDRQDHIRNAGRYIGTVAGQDLNVVPVWQKGYTGKGITVAVIDTEFQIGHEDLKDNFIPELCYSVDRQSSAPEDLMVTAPSGAKIHGTPVAGVIAATAFNGVGSRGIAYNARLFGLTNYNRTDYYYQNSIIGKANIVNESFGPASPVLLLGNTDLADALTENGIPVLKAAGNKFADTPVTDIGTGVCTELGVNCVFAQADYQMKSPGSIVVGAVTSDGTHAPYSSGGTNLWISARTDTLTTDIEGCTYNMESQIMDTGTCNYVLMGGTSAATPSATGVTALVLEAAEKNLTVNQVKYILAKSAINYKTDSAMKDADVSGDSYVIHKGWIPTRNSSKTGLHYSTLFGFGRIDADAAVELALICSEDADCARRAEDPITLLTSSNYCAQDTALTTDAEFVYTCVFTDLTDEDGNLYQGNAQIENTYLSLDTYRLADSNEKFGNSYNQTSARRIQAMKTASHTQMELLVNGDESRKSIIKQRYEFIERVYDSVMTFTTQASYLDEISENGSQARYTLRIRSPEAIDINTLRGQIKLNVYPLED